jgi:hypothetical protein
MSESVMYILTALDDLPWTAVTEKLQVSYHPPTDVFPSRALQFIPTKTNRPQQRKIISKILVKNG